MNRREPPFYRESGSKARNPDTAQEQEPVRRLIKLSELIQKKLLEFSFPENESERAVAAWLNNAINIQRMIYALKDHPALTNFTRDSSRIWLISPAGQDHLMIYFPDGNAFLRQINEDLIPRAANIQTKPDGGSDKQRPQDKLKILEKIIEKRFKYQEEILLKIMKGAKVPVLIRLSGNKGYKYAEISLEKK